jgi:hypothetical protein
MCDTCVWTWIALCSSSISNCVVGCGLFDKLSSSILSCVMGCGLLGKLSWWVVSSLANSAPKVVGNEWGGLQRAMNIIHFQRWKDNEPLHFEPTLGPHVLFGRPIQLKFSENHNNVDDPKSYILFGHQHWHLSDHSHKKYTGHLCLGLDCTL